MMASTITNIPIKTSVERKKYGGGYRLSIDLGAMNTWQFDLTEEEFTEFFKQVLQAYGSVLTTQAQTDTPPTVDATDHPDYYGWHPVAECIEVSQHFNGNLAQAIQYIWRCGRKPDVSAVKDLEKSINFLRFEIDRIKRFEGEKWAKENPPI